jgi:hypothetical protein
VKKKVTVKFVLFSVIFQKTAQSKQSPKRQNSPNLATLSACLYAGLNMLVSYPPEGIKGRVRAFLQNEMTREGILTK